MTLQEIAATLERLESKANENPARHGETLRFVLYQNTLLILAVMRAYTAGDGYEKYRRSMHDGTCPETHTEVAIAQCENLRRQWTKARAEVDRLLAEGKDKA
jgi:hypothetical protein